MNLAAADLAPLLGLAARPDVLWCPVTAVVEGVGASRAVPLLRDAASLLVHRAGEALGSSATPGIAVAARRLRVGGSSAEKASKQDRSDVQLDGILQLPLASELDFWGRAELVARACEAVAAVAVELSRRKPAVLLSWREPIARVADEEPHRARLLQRQAEQLRMLVASSKDAFSPVLSCDLSAEVLQTPISLDEVRLTLSWRPLASARG